MATGIIKIIEKKQNIKIPIRAWIDGGRGGFDLQSKLIRALKVFNFQPRRATQMMIIIITAPPLALPATYD